MMPSTVFQDTKCPPLWANGPDVQGIHSFPNRPALAGPKKVTQSPVTTGSSVLAMKYIGGVVIAADTLGSYGSMARFRDVSRVMKVNNTTVMAGAGDYADYQHLKERLEQMTIDEQVQDDGFEMPPQAVHSYLTRLMYQRRSK